MDDTQNCFIFDWETYDKQILGYELRWNLEIGDAQKVPRRSGSHTKHTITNKNHGSVSLENEPPVKKKGRHGYGHGVGKGSYLD